jgi:hypothetical protein
MKKYIYHYYAILFPKHGGEFLADGTADMTFRLETIEHYRLMKETIVRNFGREDVTHICVKSLSLLAVTDGDGGERSSEEPAKTTALFDVPIWNPLEHGIQRTPFMVPADDYNRVASGLSSALSLALQHVPLDHPDSEKIYRLEKSATIYPGSKDPQV